MPRNSLGIPIVASSVGGAIINVNDVLWESFGSNEIAINYAENYTNIVLHSQDITNAEAWSKTNVAADSTLYEAPDNSTTANAIKSDSTGEKAYNITQGSLSVTAGKTYTLSVHFKKQNLDFARIYFSDGASKTADFNLSNGTVGATSNTIRTQVDAMDDGWYRCSMTFVATSTVSSGQARFYAQSASGDNTPNVAVSGIVLIYVWGFQLEENIEASPYIVTTTEARTATETLNDLSSVWDFDSTDLMPQETPNSEGVWETSDNLVLNHDYEELGSELVTNGDFATDSNWTKGTGWSITNGLASCDGTQSSNTELKQQNGVGGVTLDLVVGKQYKMQFDATVTSGFITSIEVGSNYNHNNITTTNSYTLYFTPTSTNDRITFTGNPDFIGSIDNVSVKQVDPNDRWALDSGWSIEDGKLKATSTDLEATQTNVFTPGNTYEVTFTIDSITSGSVKVKAGTTVGTIISSAGTYTQVFEVLYGADLVFDMHASGTCVIDNVTVREYAIQPQDV